jgi:phospho-N-acetylmuramoyl-pentapeptide-transferase
VLVIGQRAIDGLGRICRERIDTASSIVATLHAGKSGTPSMGGLLVFVVWLASVATCCDLTNQTVQLAIAATVAFLALGTIDDLIKARGRKRGLSARAKLTVQLILGLAAATAVAIQEGRFANHGENAVVFVLFATVVIAGMSNAVNLSDGLDGLAAGCGSVAAAGLCVAALACARGSDDRNGQIALMSATLAGALVGFLRFNRHPARVFMGDTGSLPLGALLALLAISLRQCWLLSVIGSVFLIELASVVIQVAWFRRTGRRVFRCAPLHHHFEFLGWPEPVIVRRFWIASAALALVGVLLCT